MTDERTYARTIHIEEFDWTLPFLETAIPRAVELLKDEFEDENTKIPDDEISVVVVTNGAWESFDVTATWKRPDSD